MDKKILMIDDQVYITKMFADLLKLQLNVQVLAANNADQALAILKTQKPDLILLDIVMPGDSGMFVLETVKNSKEWKNIPVVMLSAMGSDEAKERFMEKGAIAHFGKFEVTEKGPRREEFFETIKKCLGK
jgi:CheY-like chemotaxis protein